MSGPSAGRSFSIPAAGRLLSWLRWWGAAPRSPLGLLPVLCARRPHAGSFSVGGPGADILRASADSGNVEVPTCRRAPLASGDSPVFPSDLVGSESRFRRSTGAARRRGSIAIPAGSCASGPRAISRRLGMCGVSRYSSGCGRLGSGLICCASRSYAGMGVCMWTQISSVGAQSSSCWRAPSFSLVEQVAVVSRRRLSVRSRPIPSSLERWMRFDHVSTPVTTPKRQDRGSLTDCSKTSRVSPTSTEHFSIRRAPATSRPPFPLVKREAGRPGWSACGRRC